MRRLIPTLTLAAALAVNVPNIREATSEGENAMELGAFSISLAVADIEASYAFYTKLGFEQVGGDVAQSFLILQNGPSKVGLFQGMFEENILTFNPGWDQGGETLERFQDVRDIQRELKAHGLEFQIEADETTDGPASFVVTDPDGNMILIDQHVPRPD